jgi:hypothetical protein
MSAPVTRRGGLRIAGHQLDGVEGGHQRVDLGLAGGLLGDQHGVPPLLGLGVADAPGHQALAGVAPGAVLQLALAPQMAPERR